MRVVRRGRWRPLAAGRHVAPSGPISDKCTSRGALVKRFPGDQLNGSEHNDGDPCQARHRPRAQDRLGPAGRCPRHDVELLVWRASDRNITPFMDPDGASGSSVEPRRSGLGGGPEGRRVRIDSTPRSPIIGQDQEARDARDLPATLAGDVAREATLTVDTAQHRLQVGNDRLDLDDEQGSASRGWNARMSIEPRSPRTLKETSVAT